MKQHVSNRSRAHENRVYKAVSGRYKMHGYVTRLELELTVERPISQVQQKREVVARRKMKQSVGEIKETD